GRVVQVDGRARYVVERGAAVDQVGAAGAGVGPGAVVAPGGADQEGGGAVDRAGRGDRHAELRPGLLAGDEPDPGERVAGVAGDRVLLAIRRVAELGEVADPLVGGVGQPVLDGPGVGGARAEDQVGGLGVAGAGVDHAPVVDHGRGADDEV